MAITSLCPLPSTAEGADIGVAAESASDPRRWSTHASTATPPERHIPRMHTPTSSWQYALATFLASRQGDWRPTPRRQLIARLCDGIEGRVSDAEVRRYGQTALCCRRMRITILSSRFAAPAPPAACSLTERATSPCAHPLSPRTADRPPGTSARWPPLSVGYHPERTLPASSGHHRRNGTACPGRLPQ
jgi:hypothetical protein